MPSDAVGPRFCACSFPTWAACWRSPHAQIHILGRDAGRCPGGDVSSPDRNRAYCTGAFAVGRWINPIVMASPTDDSDSREATAAAEPVEPGEGRWPTDVRVYHFSRQRWFLYFWYGFTAFQALCALYAGYCMTASGADPAAVVRRVAFYPLLPILFAFFLFRPLSPLATLRVWRHLRERHPNECPWCRYDIHACPGPQCPECGKLAR